MESVKNNRVISFVLLAVVYILAGMSGTITYRCLKFSWWLSLLVADIVATVVTYVFSVIFNNASVYDPYWSVQPPVILVAFSVGRKLTSLGVLLVAVVLLWGIRLTLNWAYTFQSLNHQDWRYSMLKEKTGPFYPVINFLGIHMVPTLIVYACTLPAVYAIMNNLSANIGCILFLCMSVIATLMQGTADYEMQKFRKDRTGTFIRVGLWKYSRHPNYLGEIMMWWGIALAVICAAPDAWGLIVGAVLNTVLFLAVSIPLADGRQSRKEGFEAYKAQTRILLPIKKRTAGRG